MKSQAGNDNTYLHERRQYLSNRPPEEPSSKVTKTLESLTEGQRKLLSYLEGIRERANWIFSNIALKKMSFAKFRKNEYLQSSVVIKILQIGQIVSDMEVIFPSAGFWLEAKKKSGERQPVSKDMGIPFGKLSFIDIKSCRNDYSHAIDIDVAMLYKDATEFIPFIAKSVDTIMRDDFCLTEEDFKYLRENKITSVSRLINIIDADSVKGKILKKALFDRVNGITDFDTIRLLKREERQGFLLAYEQIAFSLSIGDCNLLYGHYLELGEFEEFKKNTATASKTSGPR